MNNGLTVLRALRDLIEKHIMRNEEAPMTISDLRGELAQARRAAESGDLVETVRQLDKALEHIQPDRFLTTMEAARMLGVRSPNTILGWRRTGYIRGVKRGGRTMIPLSEVERIQDGDQVRMIRALDELHDHTEGLGSDEGLSEEEMEALHQARPGVLPWERGGQEAEHEVGA